MLASRAEAANSCTPHVDIPRGSDAQLLDRHSGAVGSFEGVRAERLLERCAGGEATASLLGLAAASDADGDSLLGRALTARFLPLDAADVLLGSGGGMLWLELSGRCNERCVHCYANAAPEVDRGLSFETIEGCLRDARELGLSTVQFTGGDPLLEPTLEPAIELAGTLGLRVEVYTNALALQPQRAPATSRSRSRRRATRPRRRRSPFPSEASTTDVRSTSTRSSS